MGLPSLATSYINSDFKEFFTMVVISLKILKILLVLHSSALSPVLSFQVVVKVIVMAVEVAVIKRTTIIGHLVNRNLVELYVCLLNVFHILNRFQQWTFH